LTLGKEPEPNSVRRGELAFGDATICYQQWQTCVSCHPDGRADGLNWDQQNDGLGNPKNTKSLLYSHVTPPCMITGIRESAEKAVRNGILHTLQTRQPETLAVDMDNYLKQLTPLESPYLQEYKQKDPKQKGKQLFEEAGCIQCHGGKYLTDQEKYHVGTNGDDETRPFDTPTLLEVWRTAPYLYDGRAATLREAFTKYNTNDQHGYTKKLSKEDLDALILYINTL
jgi:cytochrome c peroxidase